MTPVVAILLATGALGGCYSGLQDGPGGTFGDGADDGDPSGDEWGPGESDGGSQDGDDGGDDGAAVACDNGVVTASPAPLRRLTQAQYRATVIDVLGDSAPLQDAFVRLASVPDGKAGAFATNVTSVDAEVARSYMLIGEEIVQAYAAANLAADLACDWAATSCVESLLDTIGRRLFRRSLTATERAAYVALYEQTRDEFGAEAGVYDLLTAMLASPSFLYLEEGVLSFDADDTIAPLQPTALASRLSFFLWGVAPDDELLDAAEDSTLAQNDTRRAHVQRMMDDERFGNTLANFHVQLMHVEDMDTYQSADPTWTATRGESMKREVETFARYVFEQDDARLQTLLTASYTFVDDDLASLYGVEPPPSEFGRVELPASQRSGLLTQTGFLTHKSELFPVVHRGLLIRRNLLCDELADPPPDLELDPTRDRLEENPCKACHTYMDTLGSGFANYDAMGRFVTEDALGPISAEGVVVPISAGTPDATFDGAAELGQLLAESPRVRQCVATQWSRYATGRQGTVDDACTMESLATIVDEADGDLRQLIEAIAVSQWFGSRSTAELSQ